MGTLFNYISILITCLTHLPSVLLSSVAGSTSDTVTMRWDRLEWVWMAVDPWARVPRPERTKVNTSDTVDTSLENKEEDGIIQDRNNLDYMYSPV